MLNNYNCFTLGYVYDRDMFVFINLYVYGYTKHDAVLRSCICVFSVESILQLAENNVHFIFYFVHLPF